MIFLDYQKYKTQLPTPIMSDYPNIEQYKKDRRLWKQDRLRLRTMFRTDLAEKYNLTNHPHEPTLWEMSFNYGHYAGFHVIEEHYKKYSRLLHPPIIQENFSAEGVYLGEKEE